MIYRVWLTVEDTPKTGRARWVAGAADSRIEKP